MRVLVVDDTESVRLLVSRFLGSLGHDAVALTSGRAVAAALEAGPVDAVFTDVAMPDASGWDVLALVRSRRPGVPVVLMTGWDDGAGSGRDGLVPDAVLEKPFALDRIREVLDAVVRPH